MHVHVQKYCAARWPTQSNLAEPSPTQHELYLWIEIARSKDPEKMRYVCHINVVKVYSMYKETRLYIFFNLCSVHYEIHIYILYDITHTYIYIYFFYLLSGNNMVCGFPTLFLESVGDRIDDSSRCLDVFSNPLKPNHR